MRNRKLLAKKCCNLIKTLKKERTGKMRLQADKEFHQTKIKKLNKEYDVEMYCTKLRGGKAFAAEQKIRELKKLLLRSKRIQKLQEKRVKSNELIKKATFNLNNIKSPKYRYAPQNVENKSLDKKTGQNFQEIYDFNRLWRVQEARLRSEKYVENLQLRQKKPIKNPT